MAKHMSSSPKVVADTIHDIIDISEVLPMIETREFQALSDKRQLGMTPLIFRSARHSRFEHSIGAYQGTKLLTDRWLRNGMVSKKERDALVAYALYHDIGHPPFSHVTEELCEMDNNEMTLFLIRERLMGAIEACGFDPVLVEKLAAHENPLYLGVHDKNLGMEKFDYLERDGRSTLLSGPVGLEYLREHIYFIDGTIAVDEKAIDHTIDVLSFYMKMYKNVYLRKASVIAQRMFEKAVYLLMQRKELGVKELPDMTDSELLGRMVLSKDPIVQFLYTCYRERHLFREAIVIRPKEFASETNAEKKDIRVFEVTHDEMQALTTSPALKKANYSALEKLEQTIAAIAKIPEEEVLVVPIFHPERFKAKDVAIYGSDGKLHSLRQRRPAHFDSMEETARSYAAVRVCAHPQYRKKLSAPAVAERVFEVLLSASKPEKETRRATKTTKT